MAMIHPAGGGEAWPRRLAIAGTHRVTSENAMPTAIAQGRSRFERQPSEPGQRVEERQAYAFAVCAKTTVMNAAPDAASSSSPVGNASPGAQPNEISEERNVAHAGTSESSSNGSGTRSRYSGT